MNTYKHSTFWSDAESWSKHNRSLNRKNQVMSEISTIRETTTPNGQTVTAVERWGYLSKIIISGLQRFYVNGAALIEIQHDRLYKQSGYKTFGECCESLFHISESYA